jgi:cytokinin dehydrogenase
MVQTAPSQTQRVQSVDASQDFGHLIRGAASTVARPTNIHEIQQLVAVARQGNLKITPRGKGYSQSGQSISLDGIVLDTAYLQQVEIRPATAQVTCGAGITWRDLVKATVQQGLLPCTMPLNLNLTVGGTLSAGGIGSNSHRYGSSTASVLAIEAVTGDAQRQYCSPQDFPDLFDALLGGQGRCGIMAAVTLQLRPFQPQVTLYQLQYDRLAPWLADQQVLKEDPVVSHIEGFCLTAPSGEWQYKLNLAIEHDDQPTGGKFPLDTLQYDHLVGVSQVPTIDFLARYDSRFQAMQETGDWQLAHPWFECFLPASKATELIPQILDRLPACFGEGHRVLPICTAGKPKFFMAPELPEQSLLFAALPTGIRDADIPVARRAISQLNHLVMEAGGRRYLSGWLETTGNDFWQQHFGPVYRDWLAAKHQYDGQTVFGSTLFQGDPVPMPL